MKIKTSKIGISIDSDEALDRLLRKANSGFTGGRITKSDLASWIILYFESHSFENSLDKLRKDHFDQVAYLESVLKEIKQARKSGAETPDLNTMLSPVTDMNKGSAKRRTRIESSEPSTA